MTTEPVLRVAALPRDANPYQALLYEALAERGVEVSYLGELTPSHTVNLLLLPAEVLSLRLRGVDIVHLHWVFGFGLPGRRRLRAVGLLSEAWFHAFLRAVTASRVRLVWTAHNVLPHQQVFWDDVRARRALGARADLVIAHSESTLRELAALGVRPAWSAVVPHGPFATTAGARRDRGEDGSRPITLAFVGSVAPYKGVDDLLRAFAGIDDPTARLIIAGACADPGLARELETAARPLGSRVDLRLRRLPDAELDEVLDEADVIVLPYRRVTTSGTAILALAAGRPLVVPDLPGLAELPSEAVFRYGAADGLDSALSRAVATTRDRLRAMGAVGRNAVNVDSWTAIAEKTDGLLRELAHLDSLQRADHTDDLRVPRRPV